MFDLISHVYDNELEDLVDEYRDIYAMVESEICGAIGDDYEYYAGMAVFLMLL